MAWTSPRTWVAGETVTAQLMNLHIRDNENILKTPIDDNGKIRALSSTYLADLSGVNLTGIPKVLYSNVTAVGNITTGEDDLMSYTVPANTLSADGMSLRVTAWGTVANNANTKTVRGYWGTTPTQITVSLSPNVNAVGAWRCDMEIFRSGSSAQVVSTILRSTNNNNTTNSQVGQFNTTASKDLTASQIVKFTGEATATDDVSMKGMRVELLPAA